MRELTGRKVFAIVAGFFGVIITVNLFMAYSAVSTFPGLEVQNSYVASQGFDRDKAAQEALGWQLAPDYDAGEGRLRLTFTDAAGAPAEVVGLAVLVGRSTVARDDSRPEFVRQAGVFEAALALDPGKWMMRVEAEAADGTMFRQRIEFFVKG
ncbi:MAG: FixH family protein [Pseudorhodobacter sp.]